MMIYKTLIVCAICIVVLRPIVSGKLLKSSNHHGVKRTGIVNKQNYLRNFDHDSKTAGKALRTNYTKKLSAVNKLESESDNVKAAPPLSSSGESTDSATLPLDSDISVSISEPPASKNDPAASNSNENSGDQAVSSESKSSLPAVTNDQPSDPGIAPSNDSEQSGAKAPKSDEEIGSQNITTNSNNNDEEPSSGEVKHQSIYQRSQCKSIFDVGEQIKAIKVIANKYSLDGIDSVNANLNKAIKDALINSRGVAQRASHALGGNALAVPAGVNLGGHCVLMLNDTFLFFHRMKLRNSTAFTLKYLKNNLNKMVLISKIAMNDIHLLGSYEKMLIDNKGINFFYHPTFGIVEFLLKGVDYKLEARYRTAANNRINVELIVSTITVSEAMLEFQGSNKDETQSIPIEPSNISLFLERLRADMDEWIKDFINDALNPQFSGINEYYSSEDILKYDQEKSLSLNNYAEDVIKTINNELSVPTVLPEYSITAINGMVIRLDKGEILNLNTLYRRSTATINENNVEVMVGLANPKIVYKYSIKTPHVTQSVNGYIYYSANDISAHMTINPEGILVHILQHISTPTVSIQGPANTIIASYRHLLEHQIVAIFTNIVHNFIATFVGCEIKGAGGGENEKSNKVLSGTHMDPAEQVVSQIIKGINDFKNGAIDNESSKADETTTTKDETDKDNDTTAEDTGSTTDTETDSDKREMKSAEPAIF